MKKLLMLVVLLLITLTGCQEKQEVTLTEKELLYIDFEFKSNEVHDFYLVNDSQDLRIVKASVDIRLLDDDISDYDKNFYYELDKDKIIEPCSEEKLNLKYEISYHNITFERYILGECHYTIEKNGCYFLVFIDVKGDVTIYKGKEKE